MVGGVGGMYGGMPIMPEGGNSSPAHQKIIAAENVLNELLQYLTKNGGTFTDALYIKVSDAIDALRLDPTLAQNPQVINLEGELAQLVEKAPHGTLFIDPLRVEAMLNQLKQLANEIP